MMINDKDFAKKKFNELLSNHKEYDFKMPEENQADWGKIDNVKDVVKLLNLREIEFNATDYLEAGKTLYDITLKHPELKVERDETPKGKHLYRVIKYYDDSGAVVMRIFTKNIYYDVIKKAYFHAKFPEQSFVSDEFKDVTKIKVKLMAILLGSLDNPESRKIIKANFGYVETRPYATKEHRELLKKKEDETRDDPTGIQMYRDVISKMNDEHKNDMQKIELMTYYVYKLSHDTHTSEQYIFCCKEKIKCNTEVFRGVYNACYYEGRIQKDNVKFSLGKKRMELLGTVECRTLVTCLIEVDKYICEHNTIEKGMNARYCLYRPGWDRARIERQIFRNMQRDIMRISNDKECEGEFVAYVMNKKDGRKYVFSGESLRRSLEYFYSGDVCGGGERYGEIIALVGSVRFFDLEIKVLKDGIGDEKEWMDYYGCVNGHLDKKVKSDDFDVKRCCIIKNMKNRGVKGR